MTQPAGLPERLAEIVEDFGLCEGREKLELLLQYSESLPPLPERITADESGLESVPECMTPVSVTAESQDGRMFFYFKVPVESPTVRGFAAIIEEGLRGATPEQVLNLPAEFYLQMGLQEVLTPQRMNGMSAIVAHVKRLAVAQMA
jgi:cysteine desulfuration protein SufE